MASRHPEAYPEVTGYLVPTLLQYGERELAARLIRWLISIQRADGSYSDPFDCIPFIFDTGQVLRGLLAGASLEEEALNAARRAADYLCAQILDGGRRGFGVRYTHDAAIPETVHLYVLPPLLRAAEIFQDAEYRMAAQRCCEYYCSHEDFLHIDTLTHYLGYELEALIDLGRADVASPVLNRLRDEQTSDGAVRGAGGASWVCTPGLAQLAVCWYKLGQWKPADHAMEWLEAHQRPSGGFLGSYGEKAAYLENAELSWAAKFYLDAHLLRVRTLFDRDASRFPSSISKEDGRVKAIISIIQPHDRILDVGCGKGRFLRVVRETYPETECTGVDISATLLSHLPPDIRALRGSLEAIPCANDSFDVVFSVEAIEHSPNMQTAVEEMIRVTRSGGWVIIVDKQRSHWGQLQCPPWEQWPEAAQMARWLRRGCDHVSVEAVSYEDRIHPDGLFVMWKGQKRSRLSGKQWNTVMIPPGTREEILHRVRYNRLSEWVQVILLATHHNEKVLEVGCGTVEISLHLARAGRRVTVLDVSAESLAFTQQCAMELGLSIHAVQADATEPLDFADDEFDCVWSSGLLEHFSVGERRVMIREWRRIAARRVIALVPNAACVAYRAGKVQQESEGTWPYGLEIPILSLRDDFEAAGLRVLSEYSVGAKRALSFLPEKHPLRKALSAWIDNMPPQVLRDCQQGYLLVTIGAKSPKDVTA